jgi:hypothetical protein
VAQTDIHFFNIEKLLKIIPDVTRPILDRFYDSGTGLESVKDSMRQRILLTTVE